MAIGTMFVENSFFLSVEGVIPIHCCSSGVDGIEDPVITKASVDVESNLQSNPCGLNYDPTASSRITKFELKNLTENLTGFSTGPPGTDSYYGSIGTGFASVGVSASKFSVVTNRFWDEVGGCKRIQYKITTRGVTDFQLYIGFGPLSTQAATYRMQSQLSVFEGEVVICCKDGKAYVKNE